MARLPLDPRGYPVPWFVWRKDDGSYDFRVIRPGGIAIAYNKALCWLCGEKLGRFHAFVVGPMCGVNRVTSEPSSHRECAEYAVRACPFLTRPLAVRNERNLPEEAGAAGEMIKRNPGVTLLWVQKEPPKPFRVNNGVLFRLSDPTELAFYSRGRTAALEEVRQAVDSGLPILQDMAKRDGSVGMRELNTQRLAFEALLSARYADA